MDMKTRELVSDATRAFLAAPKKMLIGSDWVDAADGARLEVRDGDRRRVCTRRAFPRASSTWGAPRSTSSPRPSRC